MWSTGPRDECEARAAALPGSASHRCEETDQCHGNQSTADGEHCRLRKSGGVDHRVMHMLPLEKHVLHAEAADERPGRDEPAPALRSVNRTTPRAEQEDRSEHVII